MTWEATLATLIIRYEMCLCRREATLTSNSTQICNVLIGDCHTCCTLPISATTEYRARHQLR